MGHVSSCLAVPPNQGLIHGTGDFSEGPPSVTAPRRCPNGAVVHLAAALGVPWLPQTLLLAVRHDGLDPDDPAADMRAMGPVGSALVGCNPDLALHHMHDPSQDRLMIARMTYFRVKLLRLPGPYREFLSTCHRAG